MNTETIKKINQSGFKAFFTITGGGQSFIGDYLKISGGSNFVVGAFVPYSQYQFDKFIGKVDFKYCSEEAARKLAVRSFLECIESGVPRNKAIGIGVTSSLAKDGEREGREHKSFICLHCEEMTYLRQVVFDDKNRESQEAMVSEFILNLLAYRLGFEELRHWFCEDKITYKVNSHIRSSDKCIVFPASFNPFHCGHLEIIKVTKQLLGQEPLLEISTKNVDKGEIDWIEVEKRVNQLVYHSYIITNAATFDEKVDYFNQLYSGKPITFIVGADTWNRIWDVERYGWDNLLIQLNKWYNLKVKFLVFPRKGFHIFWNVMNADYGTLAVCELFTEFQAARLQNFDIPISSTEIRKKNSERA